MVPRAEQRPLARSQIAKEIAEKLFHAGRAPSRIGRKDDRTVGQQGRIGTRQVERGEERFAIVDAGIRRDRDAARPVGIAAAARSMTPVSCGAGGSRRRSAVSPGFGMVRPAMRHGGKHHVDRRGFCWPAVKIKDAGDRAHASVPALAETANHVKISPA